MGKDSRILRIKKAKFTGYCFYINTSKYGDFQFNIIAPLKKQKSEAEVEVLLSWKCLSVCVCVCVCVSECVWQRERESSKTFNSYSMFTVVANLSILVIHGILVMVSIIYSLSLHLRTWIFILLCDTLVMNQIKSQYILF